MAETGSVLGDQDYLVALWDVALEAWAWLAGRGWEDTLSAQTPLPLSQPPPQLRLPWMLLPWLQEVGHPEPQAWKQSKAWDCPLCPSCSEAPLSSEPFPPHPVMPGWVPAAITESLIHCVLHVRW